MANRKILVFGEEGVGKSAIVIQFVQGCFVPDFDPTVEDFYYRSLQLDHHAVPLAILDTAGADGYPPMLLSYLRHSEGFMMVYAIDDRPSFDLLEEFHRKLVHTRGPTPVPLVICGNKCDLEESRVVSRAEGEQLATRWGGTYWETSALANINIQAAFLDVVKQVRTREIAQVCETYGGAWTCDARSVVQASSASDGAISRKTAR
jgi:small GTP-binding protein